MKMGVCMVPWSVVIVPARALDRASVFSSLNVNGGMVQVNQKAGIKILQQQGFY
jgi:hypothetical protein